MHKLKLYLAVGSALLLLGCGEEFSTAGVSLGGTGTGYPQPPSPIDTPTTPNPESKPQPEVPPAPIAPPPPPPIAPPPVFAEFKLFNSSVIKQSCDGIERSIQLEDVQTGELLKENMYTVILPPANANLNNMAARITVCNTTSEMRFEHVESCASPIKLLDFKGDIKQTQANFTCPLGESLIAYQPSECKVSRYEFAVPEQTAQWYLSYETKYSNQPTPSNTSSCLPMIYRFNVVKSA